MGFHTIGASSSGLAAEHALRATRPPQPDDAARGQPGATAPAVHIVGAGPAGLAAALTLARAGTRVCLIDDNPAPGGQIWRGGPPRWRDRRALRLWGELAAHPCFTHLRNAQVIGSLDNRTLMLEVDGEGVQLAFDKLILCLGARERLLPFPGWTLPGVTGAGGLQALVKGGMPVRGRKVVIAGSGPLLLATAATAIEAGAQVAAIVEHKKAAALARFGLSLACRHRAKFGQALALFAKLRGIPFIAGGQIVEARGAGRLQEVVIRTARAERDYPCDLLAAGFGLVPNTELAQALGCRLAGGAVGAVWVDGRQQTSAPHIWAAGECTGIGGVDKALAEGRLAALGVLGLPAEASDVGAVRDAHAFARRLDACFAPAASLKSMCRPDTIVCRCEDVRAAELAHQPDWRTAKLSTRVGMGPCQGRTCGAACALLFGWEPDRPRWPLMPASADALSRIE